MSPRRATTLVLIGSFIAARSNASAAILPSTPSSSNRMRPGLTRAAQNSGELTLALRDDLTQHHGFAHGAVVGLMADNACAWAAASVAGDVVTGSYTINFLAPAKGERLRAKGQVVKSGKRQVIVRAEVWAEGREAVPVLAAIATATIVPVG